MFDVGSEPDNAKKRKSPAKAGRKKRKGCAPINRFSHGSSLAANFITFSVYYYMYFNRFIFILFYYLGVRPGREVSAGKCCLSKECRNRGRRRVSAGKDGPRGKSLPLPSRRPWRGSRAKKYLNRRESFIQRKGVNLHSENSTRMRNRRSAAAQARSRVRQSGGIPR